MRRRRIVLVEDDALISSLIVELLSEMGHDVCATAHSESGAISAAAHHRPELMIVDVFLSAGSGVVAMAEILRHGVMPHIFMTGGSRECIPSESIVLSKPFGSQGLAAALERVAWRTDASPTVQKAQALH